MYICMYVSCCCSVSSACPPLGRSIWRNTAESPLGSTKRRPRSAAAFDLGAGSYKFIRNDVLVEKDKRSAPRHIQCNKKKDKLRDIS